MLISAFRGAAGVERRLSGGGELGGDLGGWRSQHSSSSSSSSHAAGQASPPPAGARAGSFREGREGGEAERGRPPRPSFADGGSANLQGRAAGEAGSGRRCRPRRCAVPAGEGRRGALSSALPLLSFHCLPVLLHRTSLCQPSEWEPCLPRPRF